MGIKIVNGFIRELPFKKGKMKLMVSLMKIIFGIPILLILIIFSSIISLTFFLPRNPLLTPFIKFQVSFKKKVTDDMNISLSTPFSKEKVVTALIQYSSIVGEKTVNCALNFLNHSNPIK